LKGSSIDAGNVELNVSDFQRTIIERGEAGLIMEGKDTFLDRFLRNWRINAVKRHIGSQKAVCDLGCGKEGIFLRKISGIIKSGVGFDMEVNERQEGNIVIREANLDNGVPLDDNSQDCVTSLAVIEHIDRHEDFAREIFRILKPGGRCILTTPAPRARVIWEFLVKCKLINLSEDIHEHKKYFLDWELVDLFKKAGFSKVYSQKFQFGFNNLIVADR
jgi:2-polyprenyl-3-methyl-5-hydroxy-6-metoxy-1,4-benzoquinol methylase